MTGETQKSISLQEVQSAIADYYPRMLGYARKLCGNTPDAEDLTQHACMQALKYAHRLRPHSNMEAWLLTVIRNEHVSDRKLHRNKRPHIADEALMELPSSHNPETQAETREILSHIANFPAHQVGLAIHLIQGTPYEQIASTEGIEVGTVKSRASRLKAQIEKLDNSAGRAAIHPIDPKLTGVFKKMVSDIIDDNGFQNREPPRKETPPIHGLG